MRAADVLLEPVKQYRRSINPPYKRKDLVSILGTVFILLAIPLTVFVAVKVRPWGPRAAGTVAAPTTIGSVIEPGSMISEANYIVFVDGSNYYARNGKTGEIQFSGTDAAIVIQAAIDATLSIGSGTVSLTGGDYHLGATGIRIPPERGYPDNFHLDAKGARLYYSGTGAAMALSVHRVFIDIGELVAEGAAVTSSSAVGVAWDGYFGELNAHIKNFKAGKGLTLTNANSNYFQHIKITNTKIGIYTDHDAGHNVFSYYDYRVDEGSGVSNGVALYATGTGVAFHQCVFNFFNANWYETGSGWTVVKFDDFSQVVTILHLAMETKYAGDTILADINRTSTNPHRGTLYVTDVVDSQTNGGRTVVTGNSVNIRSLNTGKNLFPFFEPSDAALFNVYNASREIDKGDGRQTADSLRLYNPTVGNTIQVECLTKKSFPAPGANVTFQFAVKSNTANVYVQPWLNTYDKSDNQQQTVASASFKIPEANKWYLVTVPAVNYHVQENAAKGNLQFAISPSNVVSGTDINLSEMSLFTDESKPTSGVENSGTATIGNTYSSVQVPHGLAATPSVIVVTPQGNPGSGGIWVSAKDGTNITVSRSGTSGDLPFYWRAEVK